MTRNRLRHLFFGYAEQMGSFITLALANVVLPNLLGIAAFANLNYVIAYPMLASGVLGEGLSFYLISHQFEKGPEGIRTTFGPMVRSAMSLSLVALIAAFFLSTAVWPSRIGRAVSLPFLASLVLTVLLLPLYVALCAWLTALLENRLVALLALVNGMAYFLLPLACKALGLPMYLVPLAIYALGVLLAAWALRHLGILIPWADLWTSPWPSRQAWSKALGMVAPATYRNLIIWGPVLYLGGRLDAQGSVAYKIAMSVLMGLANMVPFPRKTMLSLGTGVSRDQGRALGMALHLAFAAAALGVAGVFAWGDRVAPILFANRIPSLGVHLAYLAPLLFMHTAMDVLGVELMAAGRTRPMILAYAAAGAVALACLFAFGAVWAPLAGATVFLVFLLVQAPSMCGGLARVALFPLLALAAYGFLSHALPRSGPWPMLPLAGCLLVLAAGLARAWFARP